MIKLKKNQLDILLAVMDRKSIEENILENIKKNDGRTNNLVIINLILDLLTEELATKGLQKNREPNSYGIQIEDLISYYSMLSIKSNKEL